MAGTGARVVVELIQAFGSGSYIQIGSLFTGVSLYHASGWKAHMKIRTLPVVLDCGTNVQQSPISPP